MGLKWYLKQMKLMNSEKWHPMHRIRPWAVYFCVLRLPFLWFQSLEWCRDTQLPSKLLSTKQATTVMCRCRWRQVLCSKFSCTKNNSLQYFHNILCWALEKDGVHKKKRWNVIFCHSLYHKETMLYRSGEQQGCCFYMQSHSSLAVYFFIMKKKDNFGKEMLLKKSQKVILKNREQSLFFIQSLDMLF